MTDLGGLVYDVLERVASDAHRTKLAIVRQQLGKVSGRDAIAGGAALARYFPAAFRRRASARVAQAFTRLNQLHDLQLTPQQAEAVVEWAVGHIGLVRRAFKDTGVLQKWDTDPSLNFSRADFDELAAIFTPKQQEQAVRQVIFSHLGTTPQAVEKIQYRDRPETLLVSAGIGAAAAAAVTAYALRSAKR